MVGSHFQLTPGGIIESRNLRRAIYQKTAAYGHFGRSDADFTWEATDKAAKLASDAGLREAAGQVILRETGKGCGEHPGGEDPRDGRCMAPPAKRRCGHGHTHQIMSHAHAHPR